MNEERDELRRFIEVVLATLGAITAIAVAIDSVSYLVQHGFEWGYEMGAGAQAAILVAFVLGLGVVLFTVIVDAIMRDR